MQSVGLVRFEILVALDQETYVAVVVLYGPGHVVLVVDFVGVTVQSELKEGFDFLLSERNSLGCEKRFQNVSADFAGALRV